MNLFKHFSKRAGLFTLGLVLFLAVVTALTLLPAKSKAGAGPDRPTKAYSDGVAGFDTPTFNSFTGVPGIGNEENFFNGKYADAGSVYSDPMPQVKDGDVLTLEVYVHNDADPSLNDGAGTGIAKNTQVRVALPTTTAATEEATAYISADNATPQSVYDTLDFGSADGSNFNLAYVPGSAHIQGNYINAALPDSVVTTGATIGTDALDGQMKGCFQQMVYVTLQVKVSMPSYSLTKQVRMSGQTSADWAKSDSVKAGDDTQWLLTFTNNGAADLNAVTVVDQVPAGLTIVPGSIKLINGNYPSPGYAYPASAIENDGRLISVNIGNYGAGQNAYVMYDTTVDQPGSDVCSAETLTNKAFATPQGFGAIYDTAAVTVPGNSCTTPTQPVYTCNLLTLSQDKTDNHKVTASVTYTATPSDTTKLKMVTYDFGDKTSKSVISTDQTSQSYTYPTDGTYNVKATLTFDVNGKDVTGVTSATCEKPVTTSSTPTPTPTPTPSELPNTGAGDVIGIFAAAVAAGTVAGRLFLSRKLSRR